MNEHYNNLKKADIEQVQLEALYKKNWAKLNVDEKLSGLQAIANVEGEYLGIPHELNVGASNLSEGTVGYYDDSNHEIVIDIDYLLYESSAKMVNAVAHEAYHAAQHRMIDLYDSVDDSTKELIFFKEVRAYKNEFTQYESGDDFVAYYLQKCESSARAYAKEAVDRYIK